MICERGESRVDGYQFRPAIVAVQAEGPEVILPRSHTVIESGDHVVFFLPHKRLVREVHTAVWELPVMQREAVMMNFGLNTRCVWRAQFDVIFDQAVHRLYEILKGRVAC